MTNQISIIGGGISGLVLGQCLRKRQIPAIIWEKAKQFPSTSFQNFGITLQPGVYRSLLQQLELDESSFIQDAAIKFKQQQVKDAPLRVNRSALLRVLAKDLDIRYEHKLDNITKGDNARHKLSFAGKGLIHECDLVLVTDGVHSASRGALAIDSNAFKLEVLPFVVFNGKRRFDLGELPSGLAGCVNSPTGASHSIGNVLLQITSGYIDSSKNDLGINYTLSRPAETADDKLLGRSNADAESLARQFLQETAKLPDLPEPFKTVFNPEVMEHDRLLHWLMRSALINYQTGKTLAEDGIVILGDAASPQPILGGAGANAAILDALKIGDVIKDSTVDVEQYGKLHADWATWKHEAEQSLHDMHQPHARASI